MSVNADSKKVMKDIILQLHEGMSVETAKERFEKEIGNITSSEIADIEQSLIDEGLSPDEIKKFCNVHTLLFESALTKASSDETSESHPVYLFKLENREMEKLVNEIKNVIQDGKDVAVFRLETSRLLEELSGITIHYERKEQLLFPYLEKYGFMGPSKVMWGKDNEIRDLLKQAKEGIESIVEQDDIGEYVKVSLNPLLEEVSGMIFKEENILFPTALEKLSASDWLEILRESDEVGYVFIEVQEQTEELVGRLASSLTEETIFLNGVVRFPSGNLNLDELAFLFNALPVDLTFVDKDDAVRYFNKGDDRIFTRTKAVIGRKVQNCHPPQSIDIVEKILISFKEGKKDSYSFWLELGGKFIHIRFFAVRDEKGSYLGTLEVAQDVTDIRKLEGEKRLLDEKD